MVNDTFIIIYTDSTKKLILQIFTASDTQPTQTLVIYEQQSAYILSLKLQPSEEAQDGSWHSFLLKGRDDLRLDGRIMQLLRMDPWPWVLELGPGQ